MCHFWLCFHLLCFQFSTRGRGQDGRVRGLSSAHLSKNTLREVYEDTRIVRLCTKENVFTMVRYLTGYYTNKVNQYKVRVRRDNQVYLVDIRKRSYISWGKFTGIILNMNSSGDNYLWIQQRSKQEKNKRFPTALVGTWKEKRTNLYTSVEDTTRVEWGDDPNRKDG